MSEVYDKKINTWPFPYHPSTDIDCVSGWYGDLGMIPGLIWKWSYINLYIILSHTSTWRWNISVIQSWTKVDHCVIFMFSDTLVHYRIFLLWWLFPSTLNYRMHSFASWRMNIYWSEFTQWLSYLHSLVLLFPKLYIA